MSARPSVKDRMKHFQSEDASGSGSPPPPMPSQHHSLGSYNTHSHGERKKEDSGARQKRTEQRQTSPEHKPSSTTGRPKSASQVQKSSTDYSTTANKALKDSFALSASQSAQSVHSPNITSTLTGSSSAHSGTGSTSRYQTSVTITKSKPRTSPQPLSPSSPTEEFMASASGHRHSPIPPADQRPSEMFVPPNRQARKPPKGNEDEAKSKPLRGNHSLQTVKQNSNNSSVPPSSLHLQPSSPKSPLSLNAPYSHEFLDPSPPCSDQFPSRSDETDTEPCTDKKPCQVSDCEGCNKLVTGPKSLALEQQSMTPVGGKKQPLGHQISTASTSSSASDKVVGLEDSIPLGVITGEQKLVTSVESKLRVENDQLKEQIQSLLHERNVLSELVEGNVDKQIGSGSLSSGDFPSGLSSNEERNNGEHKMVYSKSSLKVDDKGHPIASGRLSTQAEQNLRKQVISLKAELLVGQAQINALRDQVDRKEATIATLNKTVGLKDLEKRRGYHNEDVDKYLQQVTELTGQLSSLEGREQKYVKRIAELEQQQLGSKNVAKLAKKTFDEKRELEAQVERLNSALSEEKSRQSTPSLSMPIDERMDTRLLSLQALKVPDLEKEVKELTTKLNDSENAVAIKFESQILNHVMKISELEGKIQELDAQVQDLTSQNISLKSHLEDTPPRTTSDPSSVTNSEAYQLLLQDSTAKDEQIRQLERFREENEQLKMDLEFKAQELNSQSLAAQEKLAEKDREVKVLSDQVKHKDKLNERLRTRVAELTVPSAVDGRGERKAVTETVQKTPLSARPSDAEKKLKLATNKIKEQEDEVKKLQQQIENMDQGQAESKEARIRELEHQIRDLESKLENSTQTGELKLQIEHLELGQDSMGAELEDANATIAKLTTDRAGMVEHTRKQSKTIADLKAQLEEEKRSKEKLQTIINGYSKDRSQRDYQLKEMTAERAALLDKVKELEQQLRDSASTAEEIETLESNLERVRRERNEAKQKLQQIEQSYDHSQQTIISHKVLIENQQKEINDLHQQTIPNMRESFAKREAELQHIIRQKEELSTDLELLREQVKVYQDDFNTERKDREAAHSRMTDMKASYTHQLQTMGNELQGKAKELDAALRVNAELKTVKAEHSHMIRKKDKLLQDYAEQIQKLQEEVQSKTQQVKQYKKQVDQFRDQVEIGAEQADILKAQVESTVTTTGQLEKENARLKDENQSLAAIVHHHESRQPSMDKLKKENEQLQAQLADYLEKINQLNMQNALTSSAMEEIKKKESAVTSQAPPTRTSDSSRQQQGVRHLLPNQGPIRPPSQPSHPPQGHSHHSQGSQGSHLHRQPLTQQWKTQSVDDGYLGSTGHRNNRPANTGQHGGTHQGAGNGRHPRTADMARMSNSNPGRMPPPREDTFQHHQHPSRYAPPPGSNADPYRAGSSTVPSSGSGHTRSPLPQHLQPSGYDQHGPSSLPPSIGSPTHGQSDNYNGGRRPMSSRQEMGGAYYGQAESVEKDSPPSSFQSPNEGGSHQSNARHQFVNKNPGFSQSSDSAYYQTQHGGQDRPQAVRPLPTPRVQMDSQHPHYGGSHPHNQGGGRPYPPNPPRSTHEPVRVGRPHQESVGAAGTQAPLPPQLKVSSPNVYTPSSQSGVGEASSHPYTNVGRSGRQPPPAAIREEQLSTSSDYSNQLDKNIDSEIKREAWKVAKQGSGEESLPAEGDNIPLDPNLICPTCGKQYRLGEIQKFRKHAASCTK